MGKNQHREMKVEILTFFTRMPSGEEILLLLSYRDYLLMYVFNSISVSLKNL